MSMKGKAYMMAMMAAALAGDNSILQSTVPMPKEGKVIKTIIPPIPKGCTEYEFEDGFKCYALNSKSADKKHDKWIKTNEK